MVQLLQQQLARAQQRQKQQADKNRIERSFEIREFVYLKLQPYVQTSVATRACHKLSFKYFGPYQIIAKVGNAAYKLLLPDTANVHPIFHVSQLKRAISPDLQVIYELPSTNVADKFRFPVKVLQNRLKPQGGHLVSEVLIQWSSWSASMATWELEEELRHQFPGTPAWGQAGSRGEGDVSIPALGQQQEEASDKKKAGTLEKFGATKPKGSPEVKTRPRRSRKPNPNVVRPNWMA